MSDDVGDLVELGDVRVARNGAPKIEVIATWWDRGDGTLERIVEASKDADLAWVADELASISRELRADADPKAPRFGLVLEWYDSGLQAVAFGDPPQEWLRAELHTLADEFTFRSPQTGENRE